MRETNKHKINEKEIIPPTALSASSLAALEVYRSALMIRVRKKFKNAAKRGWAIMYINWFTMGG